MAILSGVAKLLGSLRRRPGLSLVSVLLLALLGVSGLILGRSWAARSHFRAAEQGVARRDFAAAVRHLDRCLGLQPDHAAAHFLAARTARRCARYPDAERHRDACERLGWPADALALERALQRAQDGDLRPVEGHLQRLVEAHDHPESPLILEALTRGYRITKQYGNALHALGLWLRRLPDDVQALLWRGELHEELGRAEEALADYGRAAELAPEDVEARGRLGHGLLRTGRAAEAEGHFEFVLGRTPGHPAAGVALARCRRAAGRRSEARELLDRVLAAHPDNASALAERGKLELQGGDPAVAEPLLRRARAQAPFDQEVNYDLALCLRRLQKEQEAAHLFAEFERAAADKKRLDVITDKIHRSPKDADTRAEAGAICLRLGIEQEGLQWYVSALRLEPRHRASREALAAYFDKAGKPEIAERHRRILAGVP